MLYRMNKVGNVNPSLLFDSFTSCTTSLIIMSIRSNYFPSVDFITRKIVTYFLATSFCIAIVKMANPFYSWTFTKPFHEMFLGTTTTLSVFSNSLLIFIICNTSSQHIGTCYNEPFLQFVWIWSSIQGSYRYLLAFFALCDITTTIAHAALQPVILK